MNLLCTSTPEGTRRCGAHLEGEAHVGLHAVGGVAEQHLHAAMHVRVHVRKVREPQRRA